MIETESSQQWCWIEFERLGTHETHPHYRYRRHVYGVGLPPVLPKKQGLKSAVAMRRCIRRWAPSSKPWAASVHEAFHAAQLEEFKADVYAIGNVAAVDDVVEAILNRGLPIAFPVRNGWLETPPTWQLRRDARQNDQRVYASRGFWTCRTRTASLLAAYRKILVFPPVAANAAPRPEQPIAVFRYFSWRIRHRVFRQTLQIRALPSAYRRVEQLNWLTPISADLGDTPSSTTVRTVPSGSA